MATINDVINLGFNLSTFCIGMEGNVSGRIDDNGFAIKSSGASLYNLSAENISIYNMACILLAGKKGSIETEFHKVIYELYPEVNFIAHTHPINTLKILCGDRNLLHDFATKRLYPEQVIFNGPQSAYASYWKPGKDLARAIKYEVDNFFIINKSYPKLILLENHGIIALGKTADECIAITETCEKAAEVFLGALSTGKIRYLSENSIQELLNDEQEKYRQSLICN